MLAHYRINYLYKGNNNIACFLLWVNYAKVIFDKAICYHVLNFTKVKHDTGGPYAVLRAVCAPYPAVMQRTGHNNQSAGDVERFETINNR